MANEITKLSVVLEASTAKFKNAMNEVRALTSSVAKSVQQETNKIKNNFNFGKTGNAGLETKEFKKVQEEIKRTNAELDEYIRRLNSMEEAGISESSREWQGVSNYIDNANARLEELEATARSMAQNGTAFQGPTSAFGGLFQSVGAGATSGIKTIGKALKDVGAAGLGVAMKGLKSAAKGIRDVGKEALKNLPIIKRFGQAQKTLSNGFNLKSLLKYGLGIRSLYALVNKVRKAIVDGFKNLSQYSGETNNSISMLMASASQLKNSIASAFAPLLNAVAPVLDAIIQKVISAVNVFGQLVGALTGQQTYISAKKQNMDYAASLNQNASAADKANEANQALKRTIMGFDQINKMDDNSSSSGSGNSGSSGTNAGDMFETVSIPSKMKGLADQIKDAWKNADFTSIGAMVADKLNNALGNIPWDKIKGTLNKVASSVATFFNGFIAKANWSLIGSTFAEKLNTIWGAVGTFASKFNFSALGTAIATAINGYIKTLDLVGIATSFSDFLVGALNTAVYLIKGVNWFEIGNKIQAGVKAIKWGAVAKAISSGIGYALAGLAKFIGGLLAESVKNAQRYFKKQIEECGGNVALGILTGIVNIFKSIGSWINRNIFQPFIKAVKNAFGIKSPSTVMAEIGDFIVQGLRKGIVDNISKVINYVKLIPGKVKSALSTMGETVRSRGGEIITSLKNGLNDKWSSFKETLEGLPQKIQNALPSLLSVGQSWITTLISGITSMHIPTPSVEIGSTYKSFFGKEIKVPTVSISWHAAGGFPEMGQLFVANENGPEMIGKMGRKTTVANNNQIVEGIKAGVFQAVMDAFNASGILDGGSEGNAPIVEYTFKVDSQTLYKQVQKGKQKHDMRYELVSEF